MLRIVASNGVAARSRAGARLAWSTAAMSCRFHRPGPLTGDWIDGPTVIEESKDAPVAGPAYTAIDGAGIAQCPGERGLKQGCRGRPLADRVGPCTTNRRHALAKVI